jgi:hypothetical protein
MMLALLLLLSLLAGSALDKTARALGNENDIRPLKPLSLISAEEKTSGLYITIGMAALFVLGIWTFFRRKRKLWSIDNQTDKELIPEVKAVAKLKQLNQDTHGSIAEGSTTLSTTLKTFLTARFDVLAHSLTTAEIESVLTTQRIPNIESTILCLRQIDQARYAGRPPSPKQFHRMIAQVQQTIESLSGETARE